MALLDGVDNTRGDGMGPQTIELEPPPDILQEFRVQTNNLSAEYGRSGGGVVNAVVKNGTNRFHGDAYEFDRNDKFDAAGWGNTTKPKLRRNTAGVTMGGPIKRNKTFFFGAYEHLWNNVGTTRIVSLGLSEWRTGNFSSATRDAGAVGVLVPIYDPLTQGKDEFPGNVIPANRLDPAAVKALQELPQGNQRPINPFNNSGNWQSYPVSTYGRSYYVGRVDHNLSSDTKLFFRYICMSDLFEGGEKQFKAANNGQRNPSLVQNIAFNVTHLFSPTFFLNFTAGVQRLVIITGNVNDPSINYPAQLGMPNVPGPQFPGFNVAGGVVPFDNFGGAPNRFEKGLYGNYIANFTKVAGVHTLKFGVQYNRFNNNDGVYNTAAGTWTFNGQYTQGIGTNGLPLANTGVDLADYLLGLYSSTTLSLTPTFGRREQGYSGYIQDDWRVTPNLTLNIGLRYDTTTPATSPTNAFQSFDPYQSNPLAGTGNIPAGARGVTLFENKNGVGKYLYDWDIRAGLAPRFGFAYRLFGKSNTVLRGGYGIFFANPTPTGTYLNGTLGFGENYSANYTFANPSPPLKAGIPATALALPPVSTLTPTFGDVGTPFATAAMSFYDPKLAYPYTQNFNVTLQHQWKDLLFEAGYLGNLGRHFSGTSRNLNLVPPQLLSQTSVPIQLRRPFTIFTGTNASVTTYEDNNGISNYNALTLKLERRLKYGISWVVHYMWSKWIDNMNFESVSNTNWGDNNGPQNIYNRAGERSLSQNNIPYRVVIAPVVELPVGKGKHWMNRGGIPNAILGGWQVSMLATFQSGSPFGPTVVNGGNNLLGDPAQTLRPDFIGDPKSPNQWQPALGVRGIQYLNPAAFANPAPFTYGNQARTLPEIVGPGIAQFNVMFGKNFRFGERYRLQLRADVLDLFNTPIFALPAESFGGSNFGIITATDNTTKRIFEFGIKLYW
jgi:hypothetical protein